jgi:hypothetical protein
LPLFLASLALYPNACFLSLNVTYVDSPCVNNKLAQIKK